MDIIYIAVIQGDPCTVETAYSDHGYSDQPPIWIKKLDRIIPVQMLFK